jgi:hypothetical protein
MESGALDRYIPMSLADRLPSFFLRFISSNPEVVIAFSALFLLIFFIWITKRLKKRKRMVLSHNYLCEKRRRSVLEGVESFYISNPDVSFTVTISDLVARSILDEKLSECPSKGIFSLALKRGKKGHLFDAKLTCSVHGVTGFSE